MRLWHEDLLEHLPRQQLLGQHRECAALRGLGWGRKHQTVQYVFSHSPYRLYQYHCLVMGEMKKRGYLVDAKWLEASYRGKRSDPWHSLEILEMRNPVYPEHDDAYLEECIQNLEEKGIFLSID